MRLGAYRDTIPGVGRMTRSRSSWAGLSPNLRLALVGAGIAVVAATLALRILSFGYPMHPDARVYAYIAERLLEGQLLYRDIWEDKAPSFYYAYALVFAIGGASAEALIVTRHLLEGIGLGLLYALLRMLYGGAAAIVGALLAGLFSSTVALQRATLMAEHPMVVFVLLGLLLLVAAGRSESRWWLWLTAGCAGGMAVTFKQSAALILAGPLLAVLFTAWRNDPRQHWKPTIWRGLLFGAGLLLPTGVWVTYYWRQGALGELQAVVGVSGAFAEIMSANLPRNVIGITQFMVEQALLWLLAVVWLAWLVWLDRDDGDLLVAGWLLASVASVAAAGAAFPHYCIAIVPPLAAAAAALAVRAGSHAFGGRRPYVRPLLAAGLAVLLGLFVYKQGRIYGLVIEAQHAEATQARMCETVDRLLEPGETMYEWTGQVTCWRVRRPTRFVYFWAFRFIGPDRLDRAFGRSWLDEVMRDLERERPGVILVGNRSDPFLVADDIRPFPALADLIRRDYRLVDRVVFEHSRHHVDIYRRVSS